MTGYQCAACAGAFCWTCDRPIAAEDNEIKTVGSRYCPALACREAEARAHGLSIEVMAEHRERWSRRHQLEDQVQSGSAAGLHMH